MPSHRVRVEICGSSYVISTNDSEDYLLGLAEKLDEDMKEILQGAPNASVTSAAVIAALGYLDQANKSASGADNMRAQLQDYLEDAAKARMAAEEARRENERLRRELGFYENKTVARQPVQRQPQQPLLNVPERTVVRPSESVGELRTEGQVGLDEL